MAKIRPAILLACTALVAAAGCAKKRPPMLPPAPADTATVDPAAADRRHGDGAIVPGSHADFQRSVQVEHDPFRRSTCSTSIRPRARSSTARRQWLAQVSRTSRITIEGHADERGTREYNLALGDRRANAAKNYLAARGVVAGADHDDQLRQGTPGRARLGRGELGAEPPRGDGGAELDRRAVPLPSGEREGGAAWRREGEGLLGRSVRASSPSPSHVHEHAGPSLSPAGRGNSVSPAPRRAASPGGYRRGGPLRATPAPASRSSPRPASRAPGPAPQGSPPSAAA